MFRLRVFLLSAATSNTNYKKYNCENCNFGGSTEKRRIVIMTKDYMTYHAGFSLRLFHVAIFRFSSDM